MKVIDEIVKKQEDIKLNQMASVCMADSEWESDAEDMK
jgi:hypothetical protein